MNEHKPSHEALLRELHSANKRIRTIAARALGATGDIEVIEPLIEALEDHAASVRLQAVKALGRFRDTRAMDLFFFDLLGDPANPARSPLSMDLTGLDLLKRRSVSGPCRLKMIS